MLWRSCRRAADIARDSIPAKWYEPLTPEDLPPLVYPKYFNDLDKARFQADSGRFKLACKPCALSTATRNHCTDQMSALRNLGRLDERSPPSRPMIFPE